MLRALWQCGVLPSRLGYARAVAGDKSRFLKMLMTLPMPFRALWLGSERKALLLELVLLGVACAGLGCPRKPGNTSPLGTLELAASPEPQAEADYREAAELEEKGDTEHAERRFRAFLDVWPHDPLAPYAQLALGRLALGAGSPRKALGYFDKAAKSGDKTLAERARMYAGVARSQLGEHDVAVAALRPFVGRTVDPEETSLLLDALATSEAAIGDDLAALDTSDRELRGELSLARRKLVEQRVRELIDRLAPTPSLERAYEILRRDGSVWPLVARKLLQKSHLKGDSALVATIADDLRTQGVELDDELAELVLRAQRPTEADPAVIGAILPLSGRAREAGEAALQGLLLAAEQATPRGQAQLKLVYRDDAGDPARALSAFEDLVTVHRAVAVIGPMSSNAARSVAPRAKELSVPLLLLNPERGLAVEGSSIFRMMADPSEEADALVQRAVRQGARKLLVLHPATPYGEGMRTAFEAAAQRQGATIVGALPYPQTTTNFVREADAAASYGAEALVLADGASRIALLAPALAAKGLWSVARGERPPEGRALVYLIPSAGFDPSLAQTSRRYLQGALFAVTFDPARASAFAGAYREQFQAEPNLFSAAAFDAFQVLRNVLYAGAQTRQAVSAALPSVSVESPATAIKGLLQSHGPAHPVQIETLLGDGFVAVD